MITAQVNLEHSRIAERERLFLVYAKQWWREFLQIRSSHSNRLVKIFAQDECGTNRPVCSFVCPLRAGRLLDSPRQAARFVSLLGYEHAPSVGGGKVEMWSSLHAFLCKGKGVSQRYEGIQSTGQAGSLTNNLFPFQNNVCIAARHSPS